MKFIYAILLAITATATALPQNNGESEIQGCGTRICPGAVARGDAECPLSCMWGSCTKYSCNGGYDVSSSCDNILTWTVLTYPRWSAERTSKAVLRSNWIELRIPYNYVRHIEGDGDWHGRMWGWDKNGWKKLESVLCRWKLRLDQLHSFVIPRQQIDGWFHSETYSNPR